MGNFYTQMNVCRIWRAYFWPFFKIAVPKRSLPAETSEGFFSRTLKTIFLRANNHRGSESDGYQDYPKTIEEGQYAHQKLCCNYVDGNCLMLDDGAEKEQLLQSIKSQGSIEPLIVRLLSGSEVEKTLYKLN